MQKGKAYLGEFFPKLIDLLSLCRSNFDMSDWWEIIYKLHSKEEVEQIGITLWTIWTFRNQAVASKEEPDEWQLTHQGKQNLKEQRKRTLPNLSEIRLESLRNHEKWTLPPNFLKINSNASWNDEAGCRGIGWIIRNSSGSLVKAGCKRINRKWSVKNLELAAIKEGLTSYLSSGQPENDSFDCGS